ncbi:hypothetical protein [Spiroplasma culicicola]|uniref:Transmembrane protein n=1 Tax=Spiroplasma culicicola AES-1 TaxID=1276246 RepID=W6A817_9MOLU|nr:hypothetical protein [Spiroplasma culicicola]AHI53273.1 hypothetical protein SCULI_v1c09330 [Spiroplasma culicicola AES-1]
MIKRFLEKKRLIAISVLLFVLHISMLIISSNRNFSVLSYDNSIIAIIINTQLAVILMIWMTVEFAMFLNNIKKSFFTYHSEKQLEVKASIKNMLVLIALSTVSVTVIWIKYFLNQQYSFESLYELNIAVLVLIGLFVTLIVLMFIMFIVYKVLANRIKIRIKKITFKDINQMCEKHINAIDLENQNQEVMEFLNNKNDDHDIIKSLKDSSLLKTIKKGTTPPNFFNS